jgi:hypothetical protein
VHLDRESIAKDHQGVNVDTIQSLVNSYDIAALSKLLASSDGVLTAKVDGQNVDLKHKTHFFLGARERYE